MIARWSQGIRKWVPSLTTYTASHCEHGYGVILMSQEMKRNGGSYGFLDTRKAVEDNCTVPALDIIQRHLDEGHPNCSRDR
jgi:hypothetical protein